MKKEKILLVVNPISGGKDKVPILKTFRKHLGSSEVIEIYTTSGNNDLENLNSCIKTFGPNRIVACGGDGTITLIAKACRHQQIIIGIIPAGSSNGLATELEIPTVIEESIRVALGTSTREIDILKVNDELCIHIGDLGLNAELVHQYSDSTLRGQLGYLVNSIPTLIKTEMPYNFTIEVNNHSLARKAFMISFTNCKKFGTGAVVNPHAKINDGKFEVLIFKTFDVKEIIAIMAGKKSNNPDFVEIISTDKANIKTTEAIHLQIDGEPLKKSHGVAITILRKELRIAVSEESMA